MDGLAGPLFIAAVLLVAAGVPKVTEPGDTTRAIRSVGLPASDGLVRAFALVEIAVGVAVVAFGGRFAAALLALLYLGFASFIVLAMTRGGSVASCGCFGKVDTPPTNAHLFLNLGATGIAIAATVSPPPSLVDLLADQPAFGIPFIGFVLIGTWLGYLTLTVLPRLRAAKSA